MRKSGEKFYKLNISDFYELFARYVLERSLAQQWQVEYFDVSDAGGGELLVVVKCKGKTKKYSIPIVSVIDFEACNIVLDKLLELNEDKANTLIFKMTER